MQSYSIPDSAAKSSLLAFAYRFREMTPPHGWLAEPLHKLICDIVQDAIEGHKRVVIEVPPQHGKSMICSVYAPVWYLMNNWDRNVAVVSYAADLAEDKSLMARSLARLAIDPKLSPEAKSRKNWRLTKAKGMSMRARGVGGGITGNTVDLMILDDLIKNHEEAESRATREKIWKYLESTITTRLSEESCVLAIMTRWHEDDYAARIQKIWKWPVYKIPAICDDEASDLLGRKLGEVAAPMLKSKAFIERAKQDSSDYVWSALYQQRPRSDQLARIKREWFRYFDPTLTEHIGKTYNVYQTVDTSGTDNEKSDYFVVLTFAIVTMAGDQPIMTAEQNQEAIKNKTELTKNIYILDVLRTKFETTDHDEAMKLQRMKWNPIEQYVEKKVFGLNIIQKAAKDGLPVGELNADKSKFLRSERISVYYKNGRVYHPKEAHWLEVFEEELVSFPVAAHNDQFDCVSYAGIVATEKKVVV